MRVAAAFLPVRFCATAEHAMALLPGPTKSAPSRSCRGACFFSEALLKSFHQSITGPVLAAHLGHLLACSLRQSLREFFIRIVIFLGSNGALRLSISCSASSFPDPSFNLVGWDDRLRESLSNRHRVQRHAFAAGGITICPLSMVTSANRSYPTPSCHSLATVAFSPASSGSCNKMSRVRGSIFSSFTNSRISSRARRGRSCRFLFVTNVLILRTVPYHNFRPSTCGCNGQNRLLEP